MKTFITLLIIISTCALHGQTSQVINSEQLPPAANAEIRQMIGLHPQKIMRHESTDKKITYHVEMVSANGKELYVFKFAANGMLLRDSVYVNQNLLKKSTTK